MCYITQKKHDAIVEIQRLRKKLHLFTGSNKELVEKQIQELVQKYTITYGDLWR